ncbi:major facilitator superfamily protein [Sarocladium implicatum]|nr:major facilitator superfamily protein [Sarocladium implicatum]
MASPNAYLSPGGPESFAQTGAEFTLDLSSDDEDLRSEVTGHSAGAEAYEMREPRGHSVSGGAGEGSSRGAAAMWDAVADEDDDEEDEDDAFDRSRARHRRFSGTSTVASFQLYTPDEDAAVRRKFDRRLVLFVALLYMLSFLDRSNIGNARIAGMDADLQTDPPRDDWYEWALTSFYASYILFEPMSLLWKVVPAHIYVSILVMSWGVVASLQALSPSYPMLVALRALLGIGEAGFTGIPFYLSFFFKRSELAFRTAIFISAAPLSTSFASTLAYLIVRFGKSTPIAPWRLLFLVEGFPSVIVSVIAWSAIPDSPQTATYLTRRERKVARLRLRNETASASSSSSSSSKPSSGLKMREVLAVLIDPIAWITAAIFMLTNMAYASLPVFLPKILTDMGHDSLSAQALSAPPYLLAFVTVLLTAHLSDRLKARTYPLVLHALFSASGYAILALAASLRLPSWLRYLAVYPAAIGFFNVVVLIITWTINNQASESRQGGGFALMQIVGQLGPLVGTRLYPERESPYYTRGMTTCAWAMLAVALLALGLRLYLKYLNRKMDRREGQRVADDAPVEEEGLVGPRKRRKTAAEMFRYMLHGIRPFPSGL